MSGNMAPCTGDMCLHVVLGSMYRGHVSACSAWLLYWDMCLHVVLGCLDRGHVSACSACCIGHILIGLEYRLVATECVHNTCVCECKCMCVCVCS